MMGMRLTTRPFPALFSMLALIVPISATATGAQSETPALESDVAVLAEGEIPASIGTDVAWRVVQDVAEPQGAAQDEVRALGFGVPIDEAILTTDVETGRAMEFGPGEAFYVGEDSTTRRESLGDEAVQYERIALVPPDEAADPGGDSLVLAGEPFALFGDPSSDVLRAVGGTISGPEAVSFPANYPALLLVIEGSVQVLPERTDVTVSTGEAVLLPTGTETGDVGIVSADGGATRFVVAMVQRPNDTPFNVTMTDTLSVKINLAACPDGVPAADVGENPGSAGPLCGDVDDPVQPIQLAETRVVLTNGESGDQFDGVTDEDGKIAFADLPPGTYELAVVGASSATSRCQVLGVGKLDYVNLVIGAPLALGESVSCVVAIGGEPTP